MTEFSMQVIEIIQMIPYGRVMTYGQIARSAGNPWAARQVVRILNSMSDKYHLPWHRVVNKEGKISLSGEGKILQEKRLRDEGVIFKDESIDLDIYLFRLSEKKN